MKEFYTVKQAAQQIGLTAETLRHYDRIGLVSPCRRDAGSQYRYYSTQELVRLRTVSLLRQMGLSLEEIGALLSQRDLKEVVAGLRQAEQRAEEKIAGLRRAQRAIRRAYRDYEKKLNGAAHTGTPFVQRLPARALLLSTLEEGPSLQSLWNYHSHFYRQLPKAQRASYSFEDTAGLYQQNGVSRLYAVCTRYPGPENLTLLPAGRYLCLGCEEENKDAALQELKAQAAALGAPPPAFTLLQVVVTGILHWSFQIQLFLGE